MPAVFCLDETTGETLAFLAGMRRSLLQGAVRLRKQPLEKKGLSVRLDSYFDFTTMEKITPTAALVLASIYDRGKHILGYKPNTIDEHRWNPNVMAVLRSVGFHELLDMQPPSKEAVGDPTIMVLRFVSGEKADPPEVGRLQEQLTQLLPVEMERDALLYAEPYAGMMEAALNSHMWAYPPDAQFDFPVLRRWWMTGAIDTAKKIVTVAVYDQGVSIPASLPRWEHWGVLQRLAARLRIGDQEENDGLSIRLAMSISKTRTGLPQHGKGLHTMLEVAQRAKAGRLRILSRRGEYIWETGRRPVTRNYEHSIGGTLIEWRIQI